MKQIHIWAAVVCLLLASCSDIRFGDDFLGDHPESSGATLDEMFSSAVNADRVLTKAYTYLPYGLPTGDRPYDKLGVNILEAITDLHYSFRNNMSDGPVRILDIDPCITDRVVFRFRTEAIGFASLKIARADIGTQRTVIIKVDRTITHIVAKTVMKIRNSFKNIHP